MKGRLVFIIILLFSAACTTPEEISIPLPSDTHVPPTTTNTPTPPTPTLTPTATPIPLTATPTLISYEEAEKEIFLSSSGYGWFKSNFMYSALVASGHYLPAIGIATEIINHWFGEYPEWYLKRGSMYLELGEFEKAIKDYEFAVSLPTFAYESNSDKSDYLNSLCWFLSLTGNAEDGFPHCEESVNLELNIHNIDSRGLTYALLGRTEEAIADFNQLFELVETDPSLDDEWIEFRREWVLELEAGKNPFTEEFLDKLLADEVNPDIVKEPNLLMTEDYIRTNFSQVIQKHWGVNSEGVRDIEGAPVELLLLLDSDECIVDVHLVGPPEPLYFTAVLSFETRCSLETVEYYGTEFIYILLHNPLEMPESSQFGRGVFWFYNDAYNAFMGNPSEQITLNGLVFTALRATYDDGEYNQIIVSTNPNFINR